MAEPNPLGISQDAFNRLSLNDSRVTDGSDEILVNPAFESKDDGDLQSDLQGLIDGVDITPTLLKIEEDNRDKFGPRSIAIPWAERKSSLSQYYEHLQEDPKAMLETELETTRGNLRPSGVGEAMQMLIRRSNAGLPYMTRKGQVLDEVDPQHIMATEGEYPCVLFTRTQEKKKTRNVWGFPIADTIREQTFYRPWQALEKQKSWRAALGGPDEVDSAVTRLIRGLQNDEEIVGVDFSSYDATVSPRLIAKAFAYVKSEFQAIGEVLFDLMVHRFITIPIWTPDGEWTGSHGVPSGSTWTNTIDSLVQFILAEVTEDSCQIQGDDGIYRMKSGEVNGLYDRFVDAGLLVNEDKSFRLGDEAVYLQRYYSEAYPNRYVRGVLGGVYSVFRAMNRIKYLERWTDFEREGISGEDFFSIRTVMILENVKHHPAFRDLVLYCKALDKNGLAFSQAGVTAYSKIMQSQVRAGVYHGDLIGGINSFETVKILKET